MTKINRELIYGHWWINNKMGSYDGLEFRKEGECIGTNWDFFIPKKWNLKENVLTLTMKIREKEKDYTSKYSINYISSEKMILIDKYDDEQIWERICVNNFADELLGRWIGGDGLFLEIIPYKSFEVLIRTKYDDDNPNVTGQILKDKIEFEMNNTTEFIRLITIENSTHKNFTQLNSGQKYWR